MIDTASESRPAPGASLPVRGGLAAATATSLLAAILLAAASLTALLRPEAAYPSAELRQGFLANDVVNLVVGLPSLLGTLWLAWRGRLVGLLYWPGALLFILYNALAYLYALPLSWVFAAQLLLAVICAYTTLGLLARIDAAAVAERLEGAVPTRLAAAVLALLGGAFFLRVLAVLGGALTAGAALPPVELATLAADFLIAPAWIIAGLLLWRRRPLGIVLGAAGLFQISALFAGLILFLLLQPLLSGASFLLADTLVVILMSLVAFVPFARFTRGVLAASAGHV